MFCDVKLLQWYAKKFTFIYLPTIYCVVCMWSALPSYGTPPLRLSLQGTRHHLNNFIPELLAATSTKRYQLYRNETQSYCSQGCS